MTTQTHRAMRKGAAVHNAVWHAVRVGAERSRTEALCGSQPKTIWVDGGDTDLVTCRPCRWILFGVGEAASK